jgi:hypothetical protein
MKNVILLSILVVLINNCLAQNTNDLSILYILASPSGEEVLTRDCLLRYDEIDSLISVSKSDFQKKYNIQASVIFKIVLSPDVKLMDINQILTKYNINQVQRSLPVKIKGRNLVNENGIYLSCNSIQSIQVDSTGRYINIVLKPETKESILDANKRKSKQK